MDRKSRAKLILMELESFQQAESTINALTILNEVLRDAKTLAEDIASEEEAA